MDNWDGGWEKLRRFDLLVCYYDSSNFCGFIIEVLLFESLFRYVYWRGFLGSLIIESWFGNWGKWSFFIDFLITKNFRVFEILKISFFFSIDNISILIVSKGCRVFFIEFCTQKKVFKLSSFESWIRIILVTKINI